MEYNNIKEKEESGNIILHKIDQIFDIVKEIKVNVDIHSSQITEMKVQMAVQEHTDEQIQKELKEMKDSNNRNKGYIISIAIALATSIIIAVLKNMGLSL